MKTSITTLALIFVLFTAPSFAAPKPAESVKVLSTKRYVFHFKAEKEMIGGTVEILDNCQNLVRTEPVLHTKNIVDFFELSAGEYTIKIRNADKEFVFQYTNKE